SNFVKNAGELKSAFTIYMLLPVLVLGITILFVVLLPFEYGTLNSMGETPYLNKWGTSIFNSRGVEDWIGHPPPKGLTNVVFYEEQWLSPEWKANSNAQRVAAAPSVILLGDSHLAFEYWEVLLKSANRRALGYFFGYQNWGRVGSITSTVLDTFAPAGSLPGSPVLQYKPPFPEYVVLSGHWHSMIRSDSQEYDERRIRALSMQDSLDLVRDVDSPEGVGLENTIMEVVNAVRAKSATTKVLLMVDNPELMGPLKPWCGLA
ncbi:unnamed protein product, partial [Amoebophrya sp. A25]